ncbi:MAG TPA: hypothetical protein VJH03_13630 [Blastocatellia bacterium]|nr:hypothetical protein [Blastocatellia bacterium]
MPRIRGVIKGGSLLARYAFSACRRKVGKVVTPVRINALHNWLLYGYGTMETAQDKARLVPAKIKALAQVLVAMRVGCPF